MTKIERQGNGRGMKKRSLWNLDVPIEAKALAAWIEEHGKGYEIAVGLVSFNPDAVGLTDVLYHRSKMWASLADLQDAKYLDYAIDDGNILIFLPHWVNDKIRKSDNAAEFYLSSIESMIAQRTQKKSGFFDKKSPPKTSDPVPWENVAHPQNGVLERFSERIPEGGERKREGGERARSLQDFSQEKSPSAEAKPKAQETSGGTELKASKRKAAKKAPKKAVAKKANAGKRKYAKHGEPRDQNTSDVVSWIDRYRRSTCASFDVRYKPVVWSQDRLDQITELLDGSYTIDDFQAAWAAQAASKDKAGRPLVETDRPTWRRYFSPATVHRIRNFTRNIDQGIEPGDLPTSAGESVSLREDDPIPCTAPDAVQ